MAGIVLKSPSLILSLTTTPNNIKIVNPREAITPSSSINIPTIRDAPPKL